MHFNHAYVVERIDTDADGNVTDVVLLSPWGVEAHDYEVTVPVADLSILFDDLYFLPY